MSTIRLFSSRLNYLSQTLAKIFVCLFLTVGLAGGTGTVFAQAPSAGLESESDQWRKNFDGQVAQELRENPSLRVSMLRVVTEQATDKENLKLPRTAEALLHIIETDSNQQRRLMAVQALSEIGPEHVGEKQYRKAMNRLYVLAEEESSKQVRCAAANVIKRYQAS